MKAVLELDSLSTEELKKQVEILQRRVIREREARYEAESLLEKKSLELYQSNRDLMRLNETLERRVIERTNTLSALIQNLHAGILFESKQREVLLVNEQFCEIFKIPAAPEHLVGTNCDDNLSLVANLFDEPKPFIETVNQRIGDREKVIGEIIKMKSGLVYERDFLPIYMEEEYLGHLWKYRDITASFVTEQKIKASEEKYRGIIENMELGLLEVDPNHNIIKAYDRFCDMTGYTREELEGQNANDLLLPELYQQEMIKQDAHRQEGKQGIYEVELIRKNGDRIWVLISGAPFFDENDKLVGSIGIHYDITHRKKLENELRLAREIAESARAAEKDFLANMSHEIRNPINAIAGLTNLMYDTSLSSDQLDYLNNIKYSADILLGLISDVLDISKIESGKMELNEQSIDLLENVRAVVQTYQFRSNKKVQYKVDLDPQIDFDVVADPTIINQILLNLIGNASKFTEVGEIITSLRLLENSADEVKISCSVSDTGIGMEEEQLKHIFESFKQADKQTKLKYGGTGLGLTIVQRLVGMYGGSVEVNSKLGEGSQFSFNMIFRKSKTRHQEEVEAKGKDILPEGINHVLIVEDNKMNQQYLIGLLNKWEISYDLANHGGEALELLKKHTYDLVLMDIRMPVMDGYETTIRIRSAEHNPNRNIPIIALTASALVDEKEKAISAGMNHHLSKPFSPEQLLYIFDQLTEEDLMRDTGSTEKFVFSDQLDRAYLDSFYGEDYERAQLMFQIFLSNIDAEVDQLNMHLNSEKWEELATLAHRIKPNFVMVGLSHLTDQMVEIEQAAKQLDTVKAQNLVPEFLVQFKTNRQLVENELDKLSNWIN